jgi:AraC family transcriptional regulator
MVRQYDLLENILTDIEKGIKEGINLNSLAKKYALSERHLRRLFKFAFKQTLAGYIRSRKLAASIDDLIKTNFTLFDIALEYGFEYEQSYRRAFKHEFGITPGKYRKAGHIIGKFIK